MYKVEQVDEILYFANKEDLIDFLVKNGNLPDFRSFVNSEYSAWEILNEKYTKQEIIEHYFNSAVLDTISYGIETGWIEEVI